MSNISSGIGDTIWMKPCPSINTTMKIIVIKLINKNLIKVIVLNFCIANLANFMDLFNPKDAKNVLMKMRKLFITVCKHFMK